MDVEIKIQYFGIAWQIRFEAKRQLSQKHKMCHVMFLQFCINLNNYKMILLRVPFFWIYCILIINICIFLFILVVD